jgi:HAD superfamily hydrolase (TIGR01509 family)
MPAKALFFDVGNTLLFPDCKRMLQALHQRQIFPSDELLKEVERRTKREFDSLLEGNSVDHGFWHIYYSRLLKELQLPGDPVHSDLVSRTRVSANWCEIRLGTREALERLGKHHRLAVISNADGKIAEVLARCGIADCFETITDSGIIGKEKPHPAIFQAAVSSLGVSASDSIYIGDVYSIDYLGATRFGMQSVLFDVAGAYRNRDLPRVESLEELESRLI